MDMLKDCRAYLADNPEGYWFKRKRYGFGWIPARWQGWALTVGLLVVAFGLLASSSPMYGLVNPEEITLPIVALGVLYFAIVWKTSEPLKWKWGAEHDSDQTK